eukprot:16452361-Heterocapsa_arctica.AAC.2
MSAVRTGRVAGSPGRAGATGRSGGAGPGGKGGVSAGPPGSVCVAAGLEVGWRKRPPSCGSRGKNLFLRPGSGTTEHLPK